jgi:DNA modification methylase
VTVRIVNADVLAGLAQLPDESVHMCVTSPPYLGLRDYGIPPQEWCGGSLGLEPTVDLYVEHMVAVFREVRRVLRRDGTLWLNIGDSYNSGAQYNHGSPGSKVAYGEWSGDWPGHRAKIPGLKPKDLLGIPWMLAFALRADGWWLRSEITWAKRAPMPESCTDRPTSATEKVFLLAKSAKYFYDAEAVKEEAESDHPSGNGYKRDPRLTYSDANGARGNDKQWSGVGGKRNQRNFWLLGPEPFPEAHFATFVSEIPRRAILAGTSERGVCPKCAAPWARIVEKTFVVTGSGTKRGGGNGLDVSNRWDHQPNGVNESETIGWRPTCGCDAGEPVPATVLEPFAGAFTTCLVAEQLRRDSIGIELNPEYCEMGRRRLATDAPLFFAEAAQ